MSIISNLIRKSVKKEGPLNILSFWYDGRFDIELLKTGHNFYGSIDASTYPWPAFDSAKYPNLHILDNINEVNNLDLDLVIFNHREAHSKFYNIPRMLHVPAFIIDHDFDVNNQYILKRIKAETPYPSVSTSQFVQRQYDSKHNINYGVERKTGEYDKDIDILISGNFPDNELMFINSLKSRFPTLKLIGRNEKVPYSEAVETFEDYRNLFKRARLFINLSIQRNTQYEILWALYHKCCIISNISPVYEGLLNENNCIHVSSLDEVQRAIQNLVNNKAMFNKMASHDTNLSQFNNDDFIKGWNDIFESYRYKAYIP
jgi:hypothetical protein